MGPSGGVVLGFAISLCHRLHLVRKGEIGVTKLDPRGRKVKILATLGPASRDPEMIS
jgi:uncharacterized membrane protein